MAGASPFLRAKHTLAKEANVIGLVERIVLYYGGVSMVSVTMRKKPTDIEWFYQKPIDARSDQIAYLVFCHANAFRAQHGLSALTSNSKLELAAWNQSQRLALSGEFDHVLSDGIGVGDRLERCGYKWSVYGENIALRSQSAALEETALGFHLQWVNSPPHRENLLLDDVTELGVGVTRSQGVYYATQNFAAPRRTIASMFVWASVRPAPMAAPARAPKRAAEKTFDDFLRDASPRTTAPPSPHLRGR